MASRGKDWIRISWHRFDDYPIRVSDGLNRWLFVGRLMVGRRVALLAGLTLSLLMIGASVGYLISDSSSDGGAVVDEGIFDPLLQEEEHDHRNASQHVLSTPNIEPLGYDPLTAPGNAEVQVAELSLIHI